MEKFIEDSDLSPNTATKYRQSLNTFSEEKDKPLAWFTEERVKEIHKRRSLKSKAVADHDMRVLRLLWNWASDTYKTTDKEPVLEDNPVRILNKKKAGNRGWNKVPRKETIIPRAKLPEWNRTLYAVREEKEITEERKTSCFLLEMLELTGLRFNEVAKLTWERVDWNHGIFTIPDTSSKNRRPLTRPITRRVQTILEEVGPPGEGYVFPGRKEGKPIHDTRPLQEEIQIRIGLWITPNDLRRVYASASERAGVPRLVLKRLLNHQSNTQEVTEGYQIFSLDELLEWSQQIEDQILEDAELLESGLDTKLQKVLRGLSEKDKRKLLFSLSQEKVGGAE